MVVLGAEERLWPKFAELCRSIGRRGLSPLGEMCGRPEVEEGAQIGAQ